MTNREKVDYIKSRMTDDRLLLIIISHAREIAIEAEKEWLVIKRRNPMEIVSWEAIDCLCKLNKRVDDLFLIWGILNQPINAEDFMPWGTSLSKRQNEMLNEYVRQLMASERKTLPPYENTLDCADMPTV